MPHPGELFIPTYSKAEPRIYFGLVDTPPDELTMSDRLDESEQILDIATLFPEVNPHSRSVTT
jgi:hypothetical protein